MNHTRRIEFRGAKLDDNRIEGAAAVIGNLDSYRTVMFPHFLETYGLAAVVK